MSQIKFACCFCSQRISGDEAYCGNLIFCPSCGRRIAVPAYSSFSNAVATPVAIPQAATAADPQLWTEEAWEEHVAEVAPGFNNFHQTIALSLMGAMALLLPFLVVNGIGARALWVIMIGCGIVSGFLVRDAALRGGCSQAMSFGAFVLGALMYAIFAEVTLFGGCMWPDHL